MSYGILIIDLEEFDKFISKLDKPSQARLARDIDLLKEKGIYLTMPFSKRIDRDIYELRISGKQKVRLLYTIKQKQIYILNWFIKKKPKLPQKEHELAIKRLTRI